MNSPAMNCPAIAKNLDKIKQNLNLRLNFDNVLSMYGSGGRRHQLSIVTLVQLFLDWRTVLAGLVCVLASMDLILDSTVRIQVIFVVVDFCLFNFNLFLGWVFVIARGVRIVAEIKITTRQVKARFSECTKHPMYKIGNNNATVCSTQIRGVGAPLTGCKSE